MVPNAALRFTPASAQPSRPAPGLLERLMPRSRSSVFRPPSKKDESGPNRTVWVLRDGVPSPLKVAIGATDGRKTAIVGGDLAADQPVIVDSIVAKR
jgi:HlyD family secretion protein